MGERNNLIRVLMRPDGDVHICFTDIRSIFATPDALAEMFLDPIEFIDNRSCAHKESTFEINRNRVALMDIPGLTLLTVDSDKNIHCIFPELFRYLFAAQLDNVQRCKPLNMKSFELEEFLSDEKSFLLRFFLDFTNYFKAPLTIKKNIKLNNEVQLDIVREILNTFFEEELPKPSKAMGLSEHIGKAETEHLKETIPKDDSSSEVSTTEYALIINVTPQTVLSYIKAKRLKSAHKDENGRWKIRKDDRPVDWDKRRGRKVPKPKEGRFFKRYSSGSAADVAEYIKAKEFFSSEVAPYIHTFQELEYYRKRSYHEIRINGRLCLLIDVNPDYISTKTGIRNRELMAEGKPPVFPDPLMDDSVFHLHHVGQHTSSPLAIIPAFDHNSKDYSAYFHQGKPNADLHDAEFELVVKTNFWRAFLEEYDKAGKFVNIPYRNPRKRNK